MKLLIFIPARKGNKKSENKNLFKIKGISLLHRTLTFAKKFQKDGTVFISSNQNSIIKKFKKYTFGYVRPKKMTRTGTNVVESILNSVEWFEKRNQKFDTVLFLPPTSPIRKHSDIKKMITIFKRERDESIMSAVHMREHPKLCIKLKNKKKWDYLEKKNFQLDYDKLEKKYLYLDGNFSLASVKFLKKYKSFLIKNKTKFFIQERYVTIDVNEKNDLPIANLLLK